MYKYLVAACLLTLGISVAQAGNHKTANPGARDGQSGRAAQRQGQQKDPQGISGDTAEGDRQQERQRERRQQETASPADRSARRERARPPEGSGNERSQEMRERRDERKAIKEDYRADRQPGQESNNDRGRANRADGEKSEAPADKKPWYKFWE
jgi:hypothetical protein